MPRPPKKKRGPPVSVANKDGEVVGTRNLSRNSKNVYKHYQHKVEDSENVQDDNNAPSLGKTLRLMK